MFRFLLSSKTKWRNTMLASLLVLCGAGLAGCTDWQSSKGQNSANAADSKVGWYPGKIKVGHLVALDMAPLFVAKEAGFFAEEGLDVETVFFSNPGDNNTALSGNSIQFSVNPFTLPYFAQHSGVPMRIIASAGGLGVIQVVIQGQYDVNDMAQLAKWVKANPGKKLKVATLKGDTLDMILYRAFQKEGLSYNDFEVSWFNDLFAMVQAFESGQVDILSHIQPYTTRMQVEKGAKLLTDSNRVWGHGTPNCSLNVMDDFLQKYPNTVNAYLKAVYRGFDLIVNDPDRAIALVEKGNYYRVSRKVLKTAFATQKGVQLIPNISGMMTVINDMVASQYIEQPKVDILRLESISRISGTMNNKTGAGKAASIVR